MRMIEVSSGVCSSDLRECFLASPPGSSGGDRGLWSRRRADRGDHRAELLHHWRGAACDLRRSQDCVHASARLMSTAYKIIDHVYDAVVVGAGGSGLRATMGCAEKGLRTACITKEIGRAHD